MGIFKEKHIRTHSFTYALHFKWIHFCFYCCISIAEPIDTAYLKLYLNYYYERKKRAGLIEHLAKAKLYKCVLRRGVKLITVCE